MRVQILALLLCCWAAATAYSQQDTNSGSDSGSDKVYVQQNRFQIPYQLDSADSQAVAVRLYVSTDLGRRWQLYTQQATTQPYFQVQVGQDGEFWFSPLTVDANNQVHPPGPIQPQLKLVVDTTKPALELNAALDASGVLTGSYEAKDPALDVAAVKVEFQSGPGQPWQPVAISTPPNGSPHDSITGQLNFRPLTNARAANLRLTARDRAGNENILERRVFVPANVAQQPPAAPLTAPTDPFSRLPAAQPPAANSGTLDGSTATTANRPPVSWPTNNAPATTNNAPAATSDPYAGNLPNYPNTNVPLLRERSAANSPARQVPASLVPLKPNAGTVQNASQTEAQAEDPTGQSFSRSETADSQTEHDHPALPAGQVPRHTRSKRFNLEYDVHGVGPAGIAKVELWATQDGGKTWSLMGTDLDKQSPYPVELPDEGIFGFRIVITSGNGLASPPPRSGELADLWVSVDETPPNVRLHCAIYGTGIQSGQLDIRWQVSDALLASRPITLSFSDTASGPWTTIAAGLENTGQYFWAIDSRTPKQVYLRLEAHDQAGNRAFDVLTDPVDIDGLIPKGRILGIRSASRDFLFR